MAYDEGLAARIEEILSDLPEVEEKKMFGGIAFLINKHMCVGVIGDRLMARVGPEKYRESLAKNHVSKMTFTGKAMTGMIYVDQEGIASDKDLKFWIDLSLSYIKDLPSKKK